MKRKLTHGLIGIFFLILLGVCSFELSCSEVLAAEIDFTTEIYEDEDGKYISKEIAVTDKENLVTIDGEDWAFAGWYKAEECTYENAYMKTPEGSAYAKYVPVEVLSVKCQVTPDAETKKTNGEKVNMRMVSTVESLNYSDIGFEVSFNGGNFITCSGNKKVYKRVESCSEANVDYSFSPKLFDTKSEYFITHTLTGIGPNSQDGTFLIRPYWKTLDGTTVYGENRTVKVSDTYSNIVSLSVKSSDYAEGLTVACSDTSVTLGTVETHYSTSENYATLRVNVTSETSKMKSVTQLSIKNGESIVATETHRNAYTEYTGESTTVDTSWYDVYGADAEEYVIATTADLYGFADIVNRTTDADTFSGQTIYLVSDVKVNNMTVAEMQAALETTEDTSDDPLLWSSIGGTNNSTTYYFGGTFDGQEHVISGIYLSESGSYVGFFGLTNRSTIKNFRLKDSYFTGSGNMGSVVGTFDGSIENVYSNATIITEGQVVGGIVARLTNEKIDNIAYDQSRCTMKNCWYEGDITQTYNTKASHAGGLIGYIVQGTTHTMEHCLFSGSIECTNTSAKTPYLGGMVGSLVSSDRTITVSDSLSAPSSLTITRGTTATVNVGSIWGGGGVLNASTNSNVYTTNTELGISGTGATPTTGTITQNVSITDYLSYENAPNLSYHSASNEDNSERYWVIKEDGVPTLKSFEENWIDIGWYYNNVTDNDGAYVINTEEEFCGFRALVNDGKSNFNNKTVKLGEDITFNRKWTASAVAPEKEWTPIGTNTSATRFQGTFDGNDKTISGIYVDSSTIFTGLFGYAGANATIQNFRLENSYINSTAAHTGSVSGYLAGNLKNVYSDANVNSSATTCGGLIGYYDATSASAEREISNCWFAGTVHTSGTYAGGIVARLYKGNVEIANCLNSNAITSTNTSAGGFVGGLIGGIVGDGNSNNAPEVTLKNCLNVGLVDADSTGAVGSVIGRSSTYSTVTIENVYTTNNISFPDDVVKIARLQGFGSYSAHQATVTGSVVVLTSDELNDTNSYKNTEFDFCDDNNAENVWLALNGTTPILNTFAEYATAEAVDDLTNVQRTSTGWYYNNFAYDWNNSSKEVSQVTDSFTIETVNDFYGFAALVNGENRFVEVLDEEEIEIVKNCSNTFEGRTVELGRDITVNADMSNPQKTWIPIGASVSKSFRGIFDGNDHTISGIYVNWNASTYAGLFGYTINSTIKNFTLTNSNYTGKAGALGSIVGNGDGKIINIHCTESVTIDTTTTTILGGLIGRVQDASDTSAYVANTNLYIKNCWFEGDIQQSYEGDSALQCGGFVGYVVHGTTTIDNCLYSGKIEASLTYTGTRTNRHLNIGGLCGRNNGGSNSELKIVDSLSSGTEMQTSVTGANNYTGSVLGCGYVETETQQENNIKFEQYENVYATTTCAVAIGNEEEDSIVPVTEATYYGDSAKSETELEFITYWETRTGQVPALKYFVASDSITDNTRWLYENLGIETEQYTDPYVISNAGELSGLATLVNAGITFEDEVVSLANNITVNEGTFDPDAYKTTEEWEAFTNDLTSWTPIGSTSSPFKGTFDGKECSILGIYLKTNKQYTGLFGVMYDATIKNLRLENSYFEFTKANDNAMMGSIVGGGDGKLTNVYSDAVLQGSRLIGGLVGRVSESEDATEFSATSCWFDGKISSDYSSNKAIYIGGIVGYPVHGTTTIDGCLYTGTIRLDYTNPDSRSQYGPRVGGISSGDNGTTASIAVKNSLSAGNMEVLWHYEVINEGDEPSKIVYFNSVLGYVGNVNSSIDNVYGATEILIEFETTEEVVDESTGETSEVVSVSSSSSNTPYDTGGSADTTKLAANNSWSTGSYISLGGRVITDLAFTDDETTTTNTQIWKPVSGHVPVPESLADMAEGDILSTSLVGKYDTSWYGETKIDENGNYVISTIEELYGLSVLSKTEAFEGETIILANDIKVNDSDDLNAAWRASECAEDAYAVLLPWASISKATDGSRFSGTFIGQNHTISGLYLEGFDTYMGLFAATEHGSVVEDLRVENSYFKQGAKAGSGFVSSVISDCRGSVNNIYSDAIIESTCEQTGGIIARANGFDYTTYQRTTTETIENCWFAGKVNMINDGRRAGGIVGSVIQGQWGMTNCVFTGSLYCEYSGDSYSYLGGMCGELRSPSDASKTIDGVVVTADTATKVTMNSCISAGTIVDENNRERGVGSVTGRVVASANATTGATYAAVLEMENVFVTRDSGSATVGYYGAVKATAEDGTTTYTATPSVSGTAVQTNRTDRLIGYCIEGTGEELNFNTSTDNSWVIRDKGVPVPTTFTDLVNEVTDLSTLEAEIGLSNWDDYEETGKASLEYAENYGVGNYILRFSGTSIDSYNGYLDVLCGNEEEEIEGLGFEVYADNSEGLGADGVYNAVCVNETGDWVLNVNYTANTGVTVLTISTAGKDSLSSNLLETSASTSEYTVTLSMPTLNTKATTTVLGQTVELYTYGNSFIFRISEDHFIINDGGNESDCENLVSYLKSLVGTTTDGEGNKVQNPVYIDAWTITHQHGDHSSVLKEFCDRPSLAKDIYVTAFYVNEPNMETMKVASATFYKTIENQYKGIKMFTKAPVAEGEMPEKADVYRYQTGQRYYFAGVTMDVIQSQEQIPLSDYGELSATNSNDDYNTTSTSLVFTITNTKQKVFVGGDINYKNMQYIMASYGKDSATGYTNSSVLSDINVFVAPHHGKNTSMSFDEADSSFVTYLAYNRKFDVVLFPCSVVYGILGEYYDVTVFPYAGSVNEDLINNYASAYFDYEKNIILTFKAEGITNGTFEITIDSTTGGTTTDSEDEEKDDGVVEE